MQEEVEQKTFNIVVSTTKLTARTILNAGKAAIQQQQAKMAGGKQSVRMLLRQNRGDSPSLLRKTKRPSVLEKLHELVQAAAELPGKVRRKEQERGL